MLDDMSRLVDVFFNGRKASWQPSPEPSKVTIPELIRRGTSHVLVDGRLYKIEVKEVGITK